MTDAELFFFCQRYKVCIWPVDRSRITDARHHQSVKHHQIGIKHFMDVAKVKALKKVLEDSAKEDKRILLFSQVRRLPHPYCSA
jgi:hypothetical protein